LKLAFVASEDKRWKHYGSTAGSPRHMGQLAGGEIVSGASTIPAGLPDALSRARRRSAEAQGSHSRVQDRALLYQEILLSTATSCTSARPLRVEAAASTSGRRQRPQRRGSGDDRGHRAPPGATARS
jgi:hypothetical protein